MKSYKFIISGKVQGVYYRANVKKNAFNRGYKGYVMNLSDGTVEATVTCEESRLEEFIEILNKGSKNSSVTTIEQIECVEIFNENFEVRKK